LIQCKDGVEVNFSKCFIPSRLIVLYFKVETKAGQTLLQVFNSGEYHVEQPMAPFVIDQPYFPQHDFQSHHHHQVGLGVVPLRKPSRRRLRTVSAPLPYETFESLLGIQVVDDHP
jgi:hypothetical protein